MAGAIWSTPSNKIADYPAASLLQFLSNHGLLTVQNHHQWYSILDGSKTYIDKFEQSDRYKSKFITKLMEHKVDHVELKGISDLAINNIKFSGNAQRRLKKAILFHGTILYNFQLSLIEKYLKHPPIQPAYRENRPHDQFIQNIPLKKPLTIKYIRKISFLCVTNFLPTPITNIIRLLPHFQQQNIKGNVLELLWGLYIDHCWKQ